MKEIKSKKRVRRKARKVLETELCGRKFIKGKTWEVLIRYSGPFLKCSRWKFSQMYQYIKKLMTLLKALLSGDDIEYIYDKTKRIHQYLEILCCINSRTRENAGKSKERLITSTCNNNANMRKKKETAKKLQNTFKKEFERKTTVWILQAKKLRRHLTSRLH